MCLISLQQALCVVGQLRRRRDRDMFHEETFVCRKFFKIGMHHTTQIHLRHATHSLLHSKDLNAFFHFIRYLRKIPSQIRHQWLSPEDQESIHTRSFRWASNECNDYVTIIVKEKVLLVILSKDFKSGRKWVERWNDQNTTRKPIVHVVGWF